MVNSARLRQALFAIAVSFGFWSVSADAQTTAFTYQGKLSNGGSPVSGSYDFEFGLFDALSGGAQQGTTLTLTNVAVTSGIFAVQLDFGVCSPCFNGARRFLDITVRPSGSGAVTPLTPRQEVTSNPYAVKSLTASTADSLSLACVSCVTSSQIQSVSGGTVSGAIPVASIPAGSDKYIQNTSSSQTSSNFNISGNGIVSGNLGVGTSSPSAKLHVIDTSNAGLRVQTNAIGGTVASFGGNGAFNIDASGITGGRLTVLENGNTGLGTTEPEAKVDISAGADSTGLTTTAPALSFQYRFGGFRHWIRTRHNSSLGSGNAFDFFVNNSSIEGGSSGPGTGSLHVMTLDSGKVGIGTTAPGSKLHVNVPTSTSPISAASIDVQSFGNAGNALASHYFRVRDVGSGSPSAFFIRGDGNIGVGTEAPNAKLHITGAGVVRALVDSDSNSGLRLSLGNQSKWSLATVTGGNFQVFNEANAQNAVWINTADNNVGIGTNNPTSKLQVSTTGAAGLRVETTTAGGTVASFGGLGKFQIDSDGYQGGRLKVLEDGRVGIGLDYGIDPSDKLDVYGDIRVGNLSGVGLGCVKDRSGAGIAGFCSSDERLKRNIEPFEPVLEKLGYIHPVHFDWRSDEYPDLQLGSKRSYGLIAQEVEKVIPEMVADGPQGFKAVNYSELPLFLLQAVRELKAENDALHEALRIQNQQLQNNQQQLQTELREIRERLGMGR